MFWERFVDECKRFKTSPSAVAKEIGLSNSATTYWKKGAVPSGATVGLIANYFGVSSDYLMGYTDDRNPKTDDELTATLKALISRMDEKELAAVITTARAILAMRDKNEG